MLQVCQTPLQRFTRIKTNVYFLPSSTSSPLYGNVLSTNGCVDGLSTIVAIVYTPPKNANAPAKYAAARFLVTMCAGTLSNAGSGCASPASHVSSDSSAIYETHRVSSCFVSHRVSDPSRASFVRRSNRITHSVGRSNEKSQRALMRTSAAGAVVGSTAGPMPARDVDEVVIPRPVVLRTAVVATRRSIVVQAQLWRSNDRTSRTDKSPRCPNTTIEA